MTNGTTKLITETTAGVTRLPYSSETVTSPRYAQRDAGQCSVGTCGRCRCRLANREREPGMAAARQTCIHIYLQKILFALIQTGSCKEDRRLSHLLLRAVWRRPGTQPQCTCRRHLRDTRARSDDWWICVICNAQNRVIKPNR